LQNAFGGGSGQVKGDGNAPIFGFADNVLPFGQSDLARSFRPQVAVSAALPALVSPPPAAAPAPSIPVPVDVYGRVAPNRPTNEAYDEIADNPFYRIGREPATFSIDVDTAGYSNVRRFLTQGQLPPRAAVRIEELLNYFNYDYPFAKSDHPVTANIEVAAAPWAPDHRLVRIGIKAKEVHSRRPWLPGCPRWTSPQPCSTPARQPPPRNFRALPDRRPGWL
jgi:hypothetical protein